MLYMNNIRINWHPEVKQESHLIFYSTVVENVEKEKFGRPNLFSSRFKKYKSTYGSGSIIVSSKYDKYLSEVCEEEIDDFEILNW